MQLYSDTYYPVATNCVVRVKSDSNIVTMSGAEIDKLSTTPEYDERLRIVSFDNTMDIVTYMNYLDILSRVSASESSNPERSSRFISLLDLGYIPIIMPPTFLDKRIYDLLLPIVRKSGIEYHEVKPMRLDGSRFNSTVKDVWGSRLSIAEKLGCELNDVNPLAFLRGVI